VTASARPVVFCGLGRGRPDGPSAVTVGMFDGVHRGHRRLLDRVVALAAERGLRPGVVTFDRHPLEVLAPDKAPRLLTTLRRKLELLGEAGMAWVLVLPFTPELSRRSAEAFIDQVLRGQARAAAVVVGPDFRFGHQAAGDVELLRRAGGFEVDTVELAEAGGRRLSSTWARQAIAAGDVAEAARTLGRPHLVEGRVERGDGRGRELGVPTANLRLPARLLVPAMGIYAGRLHAPGAAGDGPLPTPAPAVTNVGVSPTFGGERLRVEANVLGTDRLALYGRRVTLTFEHRLRSERRYERVEDLVAQMRLDVAAAGRLLGFQGSRPPAD
jgi:riboflavin kinase/FMN adenylyltransferase